MAPLAASSAGLPRVDVAVEFDDHRVVDRQVLGDVLAVAVDQVEVLAAVALDRRRLFFFFLGDGGIDPAIAAAEEGFATYGDRRLRNDLLVLGGVVVADAAA
jgi:hypothetical protein